MGFLDKIQKISQRKMFSAQFDFGQGDGEETLWFRALSYDQRKSIFTKRNKVLGRDNNGKEIVGIDVQNEALDLNAETLAASWMRDETSGKPVAEKAAFMKEWDSDLVDKLATLCLKTIGLAEKKPGEENPENPSKAQSESGAV